MQTLTYLERIPREPSNGNAPVLVLLHGRKAHAKTIFSIEGLLDPRLHVFALQAPYPIDDGFQWVQNHDYSNTAPQEMIAETIRMLIGERKVDAERLFLLGFS